MIVLVIMHLWKNRCSDTPSSEAVETNLPELSSSSFFPNIHQVFFSIIFIKIFFFVIKLFFPLYNYVSWTQKWNYIYVQIFISWFYVLSVCAEIMCFRRCQLFFLNCEMKLCVQIFISSIVLSYVLSVKNIILTKKSQWLHSIIWCNTTVCFSRYKHICLDPEVKLHLCANL
jgi:hypothetical protein